MLRLERAGSLGLLSILLACGAATSAPGSSTSTGAGDGAGDVTSVSFHGRAVEVDATMPDVDAIGYDVELTADASLSTYEAKVTGTFVATSSLSSVDLDFEGNTIAGVRVDGEPATYDRSGDVLTVDVGPRSNGDKITIEVAYAGSFYVADGADPNDFRTFGGLMVRTDNAVGKTIASDLNWPSKARRWLPLRDHPRDGAMVAMKLTFPSSLTVVANGKLDESEDNADGTKTWSYEALTAMPTYDFHVAAYDGWTETITHPTAASSVRTLAYSEHAAIAKDVFRDVDRAFTFYSGTIGKYAWGEELTYLEEPIFGGGMEHATVVSLDETLFGGIGVSDSRDTVAHEMAHHWSGNLLRIATWNDLWLSEGFAEYLTYRFVEDSSTPEDALGHWQSAKTSALRGPSHPLRPAGSDADPLTIFDGITYEKGAFVLRMLEQKVGRDAFTSFLETWFSGHAFTAVTTEQLRAELEAATKTSLEEFFDDYVYSADVPAVEVTEVEAADGVDLVVAQSGRRRFAFDLEIRLGESNRAGQSKSVTVSLDKSAASTKVHVPVSFDVARVDIDPAAKQYGMFSQSN